MWFSYPRFAHKTSTETNATVSVPQAITLVAYTTPAALAAKGVWEMQ
jgi:hypothetical protein